jgi:ribonuclease BN (tRNA processing enzyme)
MSKETAKNLLIDESSIVSKSNVDLTRWCVNTFKLEHDSDNTGFLIQHKETKQIIMYATDSGFIRTVPLGVNVLIIECNFMESLVKTEEMEDRFKRVFSTHMSLERLVSYLGKIDRSKLEKIVLVHLSDTNSNESVMIDTVQKLTGVPTFAARNGEKICLDSVPF